MNKLNKTFLSGNKLTAAELNLLTSKIDEIITNLPSSSQGGGETPSYTRTERILEEDFLLKQENGELEDGVLYIVVDEEGNVLYMWLNGNKITVRGTTGGTAPTKTLTLSEWNNLQDKDPDTVYIIMDDNRTMVIGIGVGTILTEIPTPATGVIKRVTQSEYDTLISSNTYEPGALYMIVDANGAVIDMYLGNKKVEISHETDEGKIKSALTKMFSSNIAWETVNGEDRVKSINWSMIDVDNPGNASLATGFQDLVLNEVRTAGFISKTDNTNNFAEMYAQSVNADNTIAKKASIIATINSSNESNIQIDAEKINLEGYVTAQELQTNYLKASDLDTISASIQDAVIRKLEVGDITITGTLNYNKLVGNVYTISSDTGYLIPDDATYVKIANPGSYGSITTVMLPQNPKTGLTIYIESKEYITVMPASGTALLAGWVFSHTLDADTEGGNLSVAVYDVYKWAITEYTAGHPYNYNKLDYNLLGAPVHSYMYTGSRWVETTSLNLDRSNVVSHGEEVS